MSNSVATAARRAFRELHGVVISAGLMERTVKVRVGGRVWNNKIQKYFNKPETHLVHDPSSSLRTGDVVAIEPGWRTSKNKRHVVKHIIAPYGTPLSERPPVPSAEERWTAYETKRSEKIARREEARQIAAEAAAAAAALAKEKKKLSQQHASTKSAAGPEPQPTQKTSINDVD